MCLGSVLAAPRCAHIIINIIIISDGSLRYHLPAMGVGIVVCVSARGFGGRAMRRISYRILPYP